MRYNIVNFKVFVFLSAKYNPAPALPKTAAYGSFIDFFPIKIELKYLIARLITDIFLNIDRCLNQFFQPISLSMQLLAALEKHFLEKVYGTPHAYQRRIFRRMSNSYN